MSKKKFTTFIIGAQKASTSSLHFMLMQHPEVATLRDEFPIFEYDYKMGEMERLLKKHERLKPNSKIFLLKRPALLYSDTSIKQIYNHNSKAKFICILRDPVERAVSNALHYMKMGRISFRSIDEIIQKSMNGCDDIFVNRLCQWGLYGHNLDQWLKIFPRKNFLFFKNEDMRQPYNVLPRIENFLDICPTGKNFSVQSNIKTKKAIKSYGRLKTHYNLSRLTRKIKKNGLSDWREPKFLCKGVNSIFNLLDEILLRKLFVESICCNLSSEIETKLRSYYLEDIELTESVTGLNLQSWKLQKLVI